MVTSRAGGVSYGSVGVVDGAKSRKRDTTCEWRR